MNLYQYYLYNSVTRIVLNISTFMFHCIQSFAILSFTFLNLKLNPLNIIEYFLKTGHHKELKPVTKQLFKTY